MDLPGSGDYLLQALKLKDDLGKYFTAYKLDLSIGLPITEYIATQIWSDECGVRLALAEAHQQLDLLELAIDQLQDLYRLDPDDLIVRLSLAEGSIRYRNVLGGIIRDYYREAA
jgi:hypothetical protein